MKHILTIAAILLLVAGATAQNLSYSAVVRNSANELVASKSITVTIAIANSENGSAVYSETHAVTTNQNGLVSLTIGEGTNQQGSISFVTWPTAFITSTYMLPGDETVVNTVPVNAVPYTFYADSTGHVGPGAIIAAISDLTDDQKAALRQALGITEGGTSVPEGCMELAPITTSLNEDGTAVTFSCQVVDHDASKVYSITLDVTKYHHQVIDSETGETIVYESHSTDSYTPDEFWYSYFVGSDGSFEFEKETAGVDSFAVTVSLYMKPPTNCVNAYSSVKFVVPGGNEPVTFTCGTSKATDVDGNEYRTVQIGTKCWMAENLRVKHYAANRTGTPDLVQSNNASTTAAYWAYPGNNETNFSTYGLLYNWYAVMGGDYESWADPSNTQGICPEGWHVPSRKEFDNLVSNLSGNRGQALAADTLWNSSSLPNAVGYDLKVNNASGFSALPAGHFNNGGCYGLGGDANFWSCTPDSSPSYADRLSLSSGNIGFSLESYYKNRGFSVRCVKN